MNKLGKEQECEQEGEEDHQSDGDGELGEEEEDDELLQQEYDEGYIDCEHLRGGQDLDWGTSSDVSEDEAEGEVELRSELAVLKARKGVLQAPEIQGQDDEVPMTDSMLLKLKVRTIHLST